MRRLFIAATVAASVSVSASDLPEKVLKDLHEAEIRQHFHELIQRAFLSGFASGVAKCRGAA